jgi:hypothetical protein
MRFHKSTLIGMIVGGVATFALVGAVAFAFLSIRSTPESPGAEPAAYVIVGIAVLLAALMAAAMAGALVAGIRRLLRRNPRTSS